MKWIHMNNIYTHTHTVDHHSFWWFFFASFQIKNCTNLLQLHTHTHKPNIFENMNKSLFTNSMIGFCFVQLECTQNKIFKNYCWIVVRQKKKSSVCVACEFTFDYNFYYTTTTTICDEMIQSFTLHFISCISYWKIFHNTHTHTPMNLV